MEHFCEIILNSLGPVAHEEIPFNRLIFLFLALLAIFQQSETTLAIFEEGNMRIICVELFRFWTNGSSDVALRYFLFSSVSHFV